MSHKRAIETLDRTIKDIKGNRHIMEGMVVLLAGNFRQTLPYKAIMAACSRFSTDETATFRSFIACHPTNKRSLFCENALVNCVKSKNKAKG
ncbi:hypothetical protein EVAR_43670_1 [Eumeta japonica]|uniref:ATP-dependent DNA helicase n=1 Tax=Eumeta variegata TaxID=151549 RepID=A0A4C1XYN2_EUMVA|nr:hypothetical protein EVAR_43670_1 [Eumeta japonica]